MILFSIVQFHDLTPVRRCCTRCGEQQPSSVKGLAAAVVAVERADAVDAAAADGEAETMLRFLNFEFTNLI